VKNARKLPQFEWLGNIRVAHRKNAVLHGLSFLMAIVLIVAGRGQLTAYPLVSALVLSLFGCGYAIACKIFDESNYVYPTLTLWTFSFYLVCYALGLHPLYFPLVATLLLWALWSMGRGAGLGSEPINEAIQRCIIITTIFFGFWAKFYNAGDFGMVASVFLLYGLSLALFHHRRPRTSFAYCAAIFLGLSAFYAAAIPDFLPKQQYAAVVQPIVALIMLLGVFEQTNNEFNRARPYYITAIVISVLCLLSSMVYGKFLLDELATISLSIGLPLLALNRVMKGHRNDATEESSYGRLMLCLHRATLVAAIPFILLSPLMSTGNAGVMSILLAALSVLYIVERDRGPLLGHRIVYWHQLAFFGAVGLCWAIAPRGALAMSASWGMATLSILFLGGWAWLKRAGRAGDSAVMADCQATLAGTMVILSVFGPAWSTATLLAGAVVTLCCITVAIAERRMLTVLSSGAAAAFLISAAAGMTTVPFTHWLIPTLFSLTGVIATLMFLKKKVADITWATFSLALATLGMAAALHIPDATISVICFAVSLGVPMAMASIYYLNKKVLATCMTVLINMVGFFTLLWQGRLVSPLVLGGAVLLMVPFLAAGWYTTNLWSYAGATTAALAIGVLIPMESVFGPSWILMLTAAVLCAGFLTLRPAVKDELSRRAIGAVAHSVALYTAIIMCTLLAGTLNTAVALPLLLLGAVYYALSSRESGLRSIAYVFFSVVLIPLAAAFNKGDALQTLPIVALVVPIWAIAAVFRKGTRQENYCRASLLLGLLFCATGVIRGTISVYVICLSGFLICLLLRREKLYVQLVLVALAVMGYSWIKGFSSHFSQELYSYMLCILFLALVAEMSPYIMRNLDRIVPLPFIRLISWRGIGLGAVIGAMIALICVSGFSLAVTEHPAFCKSCHNMDNFFESWQHSSHKDVACVQCHYSPGFAAHVEGKIGAINQVVSFVTHRYGERPHAEVSNAACQRPGCHSDITENKDTFFKDKVHFSHSLHRDAMVPGRDMPCVTCHSQLEKDEHIGISSSTCFLCHFHGDGKAAKQTYNCQTCHEAPEGDIAIGDTSFNHKDFFDDRKPEKVDCHICHRTINGGDASVSEVRCQACHYGEKLGTIDLTNTEKLHEQHVHDEKVGCFECHGILRHGITTKARKEDAQNCQNCHDITGQHSLQASMYLGEALDDLKGDANVMYPVGISCTHCHGKETRLTRGGKEFTTHISTAKYCVTCHADEDYEETFVDWQNETKDALEETNKAINELTELITAATSNGTDKDKIAAASERLERAKKLTETVEMDGSLGVHNTIYTGDILDTAKSEIKKAKLGLEAK